MCTGIFEKVVNSPNWDMNDHYDAMLIWRTAHLKWMSTVQLVASKGFSIELVLAGCKGEEPFTTLVLLGNQQLHTKFDILLWDTLDGLLFLN
jgi:hypothetical protein